MIHIATIHWKTDKWIKPQFEFLSENLKTDFKIYTFLPKNSTVPCENTYSFVSDVKIEKHEHKLNILGDIICSNAEENDIIIFIDSDAFPIRSIDNYLKKKLSEYFLIAIRREENLGEKHPHPSFLATKVGFWKKSNLNWNRGFYYLDSRNKRITDVGSLILEYLTKNKIQWYPLLRSNNSSLHPLLYGVYDNVIYHHGAGSREVITRRSKFDKLGNWRRPKWKIMIKKFVMKIIENRRKQRKKKVENIIGDKPYSDIIFEKIKNDKSSFIREIRNEIK
jgi:hypothetical protein